jgi:hypothetical protein
MTQSRLDELKDKIKSDTIVLSEIAELCSETLETVSKHSKDIKSKLSNIENQLELLKKEIQEMNEKSNLGFGVILDDEED